MCANREQLEALITSLLTNAMDHAEPGTTIEVEGRVEGGTARITIRNTRAAVATHRGLGLGLYICDQLVASLGGSLVTEEGRFEFATTLQLPLDCRATAVAS